MGRPKLLLTNDLVQLVNSDLKEIKDSDVVVKLLAIKAAFDHKESEVATIFNVSRSTLLRWISNYKEYGIEGCKNKSRGHNPSKLNDEEKIKIKQWILTSKDRQGKQVHWTLQRLIKEILLVFNKEITKTPLWLTLLSMNLSLKKPRPQHRNSDIKKREEFKKNSRIN
jgi:transposase